MTGSPEAPEDSPALSSRRGVLAVGGCGAAALALAACGSATGTGTTAAASATSGGGDAATLAAGDVPEGGGTILTDSKVVVTQPTAGQFMAFSAVCTHQGCIVSAVTDTIECACHNSRFALTDGSVVSGPATSPLPALTVRADGDTLTVT